MRIQHNIMAMNAYRNYTTNTSALSKNLEKLSSGYKINRAGDDAAGLAISEKMRAQITGLDVAQKNAKDGISLVQTAEGALTEVHDMLNRMFELAEQSANGTYDEFDRQQLNKELTALNKEIDRISESSNFNGIKLLDGTWAADGTDGVATAANAGTPVTITGTWGGAALSATKVSAAEAKFEVTISSAAASSGTMNGKTIDGVAISWSTDLSTTMQAFVTAYNASTAGKDFTVAWSSASNKLTFTAKTAGVNNNAITLDPTFASGVAAVSNTVVGADAYEAYKMSAAPQSGDSVTIDGKTYTYASGATGTDGKTFSNLTSLQAAAKVNGITLDIGTPGAVTATKDAGGDGNGLKLQIGDTAETYDQISVTIGACDAGTLKTRDLNITTQEGAKEALQVIKNAINTVSGIRGDLGAVQNRLDHTINNLSVMQENIQDAESTIRDTDVADEMMAYTKNNILVQSAQAMLAQANQVPQGVLQLLQ